LSRKERQKFWKIFGEGGNKITGIFVNICEAAREAIPLSGWATSADMAALAGSHFFSILAAAIRLADFPALFDWD
jgi:hypothetical protein